jgi:hypothetical protein
VIDRRIVLLAVAGLGVAGAVGTATPGRRAAAPPVGPPVVITGPSQLPAVHAPGPGAVSRTFAAAYAAFVYGRLTAAQLPDVSPEVRRQAAAVRPAPPPAVLAAADPRLRSLRLARRDRSPTATAVVVIEDGPSVYEIALDLRRRPTGWTITGLVETS